MNIEVIGKTEAKLIGKVLEGVLKNSPELKSLGLEVRYSGGSFNSDEFTAKVKFSTPLKTANPAASQELEFGLAKRGSQAILNRRTVTIVEARRSKYVFFFNDAPEENKIADFSYFRPIVAGEAVRK